MSNEPIIKFKPAGKPEQLTRADLKGLTAEEIEDARQKGHLEGLLKHGPKFKPEQPQ